MKTSKTNAITSETISISAFLATIIVVIRHSYNAHVYWPLISETGPQDAVTFIQIFCKYATRNAVPLFFVLSGYLFFFNFDLKTELLRKWKKRVRSLVVPYIIWNSLLLLLLLFILPNVNFLDRLSSIQPLELNIKVVIRHLTLSPAAGQFWFIRDLIIFVLLAPVFYCCFQIKGLAIIIGLALFIHWEPVDTSVFSSEGLICYFIGAWVGHRGIENVQVQKKSVSTLSFVTLFYGLLCLTQTLLNSTGAIKDIIAKISILVGVVVIMLAARQIQESPLRSKIINIAPYSFFLYAMHSPLIRFINKFLLSFLPQSQISLFLAYLLSPILTIGICLFVARTLKLYLKNSYFILTGGR